MTVLELVASFLFILLADHRVLHSFPTRRSSDLICILTKNVITSCSVTMMLFLHLEVKPLMTPTTVLYLDRKSGSAGMPRPISYAVFCLKKKMHVGVRPLRRERKTLPCRRSDSVH